MVKYVRAGSGKSFLDRKNPAPHEKDFESAGDIKKCVIDPNGTFFVEGSDLIKDEDFKREVLEKINKLTVQLSDLQNLLQKT